MTMNRDVGEEGKIMKLHQIHLNFTKRILNLNQKQNKNVL